VVKPPALTTLRFAPPAFCVTVPASTNTGGYTVNDTGCFAESPINIVKYTGDTVHLPLRGV